MLRNRNTYKKIRNILVLIMAIGIIFGIYKYIEQSRAEDIILVKAVAIDNYGYIENEEFDLEAKKIEDNLYEIELPETINTKKIAEISNIMLKDAQDQKTIVKIEDNKIYLTDDQVKKQEIDINTKYDVAILKENEDNTYEKTLLLGKNESERKTITQDEEIITLYNKILKYEDSDNNKIVELKGYLPENAEIEVKEVTQEQITQIFGENNAKVKVAYDIKILQRIITKLPEDEIEQGNELGEIEETIEIKPEDFGEVCEVSIKDLNIAEKSKVYHVKEDNTFEQVNVTENTEGNISFEAKTFSIYAVSDGEIEPDPGGETGASCNPWLSMIKLKQPGESDYTQYDTKSGNVGGNYITVPYGTIFGGASGHCNVSSHNDWNAHGSALLNGKPWNGIQAKYINGTASSVLPSAGKVLDVGVWKFHWVCTVQGAGGGNSYNVTVIDPPKVTVSTHNCDWRKTTLSVTLTVTTTSTWATTNSYQYYISTSENALTGGSWITYTADTANTINLGGRTGIYYLYVKKVLNSDNSVSEVVDADDYSVDTTINSVVYHRFGPYHFDHTAPEKGSFGTTSLFTNKTQATFFLSGASDAHSGLDKVEMFGSYGNGTAYRTYETASYDSTNNRYYKTFTFADLPNVLTGEKNQGEGNYCFGYIVKDKAGNSISGGILTVVYDTTAPTISVSPTSCSWRNSALSVTITTTDPTSNGTKSGVSQSNSYQYYLSNSATALSGGTWTTYTNGTAVTLNPSSNGTYYLFVKRVRDEAGNTSTTSGTSTTISGTTYQRFGGYNFDKSAPTISVSTASCTWRNSALSTTITVADTGGSGLSTSNSYQYYLSNSATALSGGAWTTYTSGTAISLNPGTTGTYYLFVKRVKDNAGNTSTANGTAATVSGTTYQRFGAYQFDYTAPTKGTFSISANYTKQSSVTLYVTGPTDAHSGIDKVLITGWYGTNWVSTNASTKATYDSTNNRYYVTYSFADLPDTTSGKKNQGEGRYTFDYYVYDKAGNRIYGSTQWAIYDYTSPVIEVSTTACKWRSSAINTTITVSDTGGSGLKSSNTYQYYLSNSATALAGGSWQSYSSGNEITLNPGTSGTYYLFIKRISDNAGNASTTKGTSTTVSGTTYQRFGAYQFDYSKPTISVSTASCTWRNSAISTTITVSESGGAGLLSSNSYQYYLSNSSTALSGGTWTTYTSGTAVSLNPGASGTYYLFVKRVSDNARNTSTANGTATTVSGTVYQRFGAYQFDYTKPRWEISSVTTDAQNGSVVVEILGKDDESGIASSGLLLTKDTIGVYINGIEPQEATKTLSSPTIVSSKQVKYTLTLSNIIFSEGDDVTFTPIDTIVGGTAKYRSQGEGSISIKITAGTLKDQVGNSSDELNTKAAEGADTIGPQIYEVKKTQNATAKTETIIFNVTDKYYDPADILAISEIIVSVDGVQAASITKSLTYKEIRANVEGTVKTLGHQYTLVLSNIAESTKQTGKSYLEWSGTLQVKLADQSVKDSNGNSINNATTISDFVDYIKPEIEKVTVSNPKNTTNKTYTMSFKTIDKYIDTTKKIAESDIKVYIDGEEATSISKKLTSTAITATVNKTINGSIVTGSSQTVGYTYTLVLSNFEQSTKQSGKSFKEWSGTVKIEIAQRAVKDTTGNTLASTATFTGDNVDFIKPVIERVSATSNTSAKTQTITFNVYDKYIDTTKTLASSEVTVYVDGQSATGITKTVTRVKNFTATVNGNSTHVVGQQYQVVLSGFEQSTRSSGDYYKNWSGTTSIEIAQTAFKDTSSNTLVSDSASRTVQGTFSDFLKPEFTYKASTTTIGNGNNGNTKKVTVLFDVTDKYFSSTDLAKDTSASLITVKVANTVMNTTVNVNKTLTKKNIIVRNTQTDVVTYKATNYTLGTNEAKIGERYELVVQGLEQLGSNGLSNGYSYSGPMSIAFPSGKIKDTSSNTNDATTITIGVDETDGNANTTAPSGGTIVDVVAPVWELASSSLDDGVIKLRAKDKYFSGCTITASKIKVYVNGVESTVVGKDITSVTPTNITETVDGKANTVVGKEYTLKLSNLTTGGEYVTFTPTETIVGGTAKYRAENGGDISITIEAGTIKDQSGNTSREQSFDLGRMDSTLPEVYEVQKNKNASAKTETIIFNVTDRNYDPTDLVTASEITVSVDGVQVSGITKTLTYKEIKTNIDGVTNKVLGHQYTLVLSNIVESAKQSGKSYLEWSGTLQIKIAENAAKDKNGNILNAETTTISDFVDFIKPEIERVTVSNPKNTTNKTYTMSFKTIDKYIDTTKKIAESDIKVYIDGEEATSISKKLTSTAITATVNKTINGSIVTGSSQTVGYTYTLVLSNFEQSTKQSGKSFKEWSGTVKIEIAQRAVKDTTGNTLASTATFTGDNVDFIKPVIERVSATSNTSAKTQTITFNVYDKYIDTTKTLASSEVTVYVDGQSATGITKTVTRVKNFTATVNGDSTHVVGQQYQVVLSGFEQSTRKSGDYYKNWSGTVKIEIAQTAFKDTSSNTLASESASRTVQGAFSDFLKPEFTYKASTTTIGNGNNGNTKKVTVLFDVVDKHFSSTDLATDTSASKITVKVANTEINATVNASKTLTKKNIIVRNTLTNAVTYNSTDYTLSTNETKVGERYELVVQGLEQLDSNGLSNGYLYSGPMSIAFPSKIITDTSSNQNDATTITIGVDEEDGNANTTAPSGGDIVDVVAPTWELGSVSLENGTIKLRAIDKYFSTCTLTANSITVYVNGVESTAVVKDVTSTAPTNITDTVDGKANTVVGKEYTLQLSNLTTGGSYVTFTPTTTIVGGTAKYRGENGGEISIKIAAGTIKDKSGNTSREQSFEIGNMDSTLPEVYEVQKTKNASAKTETIIFNVTDRNYDPTDLVEASEISVYVDGVQVSGIVKSLTSKEINANIDATVKTLGHQYTLILSNIVESSKQSGKSYLEWSGTLQIKIAANASKDLNGNTLNTATTTIGDFIDFIKPEIERVTVTNPINTTNRTYTMSFKTLDKYIDTTKKIAESDIKVYIDGEEATSITKTLTSTAITATVNKTINGSIVTGSSQTIGYTYTLVLSNFVQSTKQTGKSFKEWSGTVKIEIAQSAVKDTTGNTLASTATFTGDYVDFIQPTLEYTHQTSNINTGTKTYTMTFEVIDKYYSSGEITINDLTILMKNGQKDSSGNEIIYNLKNEPVTISLRKTDKTATFNKTVSGTVKNGTYTIGHTYTLTISNLEHLEIKDGHNTADYSGIVTVAVAGNKIQDAKSNKNIGTTITSGVNIPGGTVSSDAVAVDVVRPIFTKLSSTASAIDPANKASSTATIKFKGTDTYFKASTLTANNIKVIVNGIEATGVSKTLDSKTDLKEDRIVNGTNTTGIKYGEEYTLTIKGFAQDANQVKIRIPAGVLTDETGNSNAETDLILYNTLIKTDTESTGTSPFLVNSVITRQNIQKVIFKSDLTGINTSKSFDVSAQQDGSIKAWYNESAAPYTVYIGSNDEIFANTNSTYLFAYIGSSTTSTATTAVENLNLLNVKSVTNMKGMFESFGSNAMTSLTLPTTFDTSNVTDMSNMFYSCGYKAMTSLNLGANFITSSVTGMSYMFNSTGYTKMTSLNLGNQFNTSKVKTMLYMFNATGHEAMKSLNLGNLFDTSSVTSMVSMFEECGYKAMTVLNLGNNFDTQNVTNMNRMFKGCGHTAMTSLELGDKFYTKKVTNMNNMFNGCGRTAMIVLDLGPAFTNIPESCQGFITDCGTASLVIYAGEAIYSDKTSFRIYY